MDNELNYVLEVENLTKSYGTNVVVNNVSISVKSGEVFGFLGPNGAGKTSFIKSITGLSKFDSGVVRICGFDLKKQFVSAMGCIGAIIESPDLYGHLSGLDNLKYLSSFYPNVTNSDIMEAIDFVGMSARCREKLSKYSLGMKQRIGIAQAIINKPKLLILDEPTNGLDPSGIKEIRELFIRLAKERGVSILISSHILHEMQLMCDRIGIINRGLLKAVRSIGDINNGEGLHRVTFNVDDIEKAIPFFEQAAIPFKATENTVAIEATNALVGKLNYQLNVGGVTVFSINTKERTLEDLFMELTGGGNAI